MSNKNGDGFNNLAARRFKIPDKVDLMSQKDVFHILDTDFTVILDQITQFRINHGKFPKYLPNAFANISTALWFHDYIMDNVAVKVVTKKRGKKVKKKKIDKINPKKLKFRMKTELTDEDLESLRFILADIYKKSLTNFYSGQTQEIEARMKYLGDAFARICPKQYAIARQLGRSKDKTKELIIQVYGDPVQNMRYVCKLFDEAKGDVSDKKKLKIMKSLYGEERFVCAVGAAMTLSKNDSDCIAMLFEYMMSKKKDKKRAPYLKAYAEAYKANKNSNYRMQDPAVWKKNKKLYRMLGEFDEGFKKSYKHLKPKEKDNPLVGSRDPKPHKMPRGESTKHKP